MKTYEILTTNGTSQYFESDAKNIDEVLDEFCQLAGYVNLSDCLNRMDWDKSTFEIREVTA
jgi:hypothetical protein